MLSVPKIDNYLEILTDEEVKDFAAISFSESIREVVLRKVRKVAKLLYFFLTTSDEVITLMLRFWIFLIQNHDWLILKQWLKQFNRIVK